MAAVRTSAPAAWGRHDREGRPERPTLTQAPR